MGTMGRDMEEEKEEEEEEEEEQHDDNKRCESAPQAKITTSASTLSPLSRHTAVATLPRSLPPSPPPLSRPITSTPVLNTTPPFSYSRQANP